MQHPIKIRDPLANHTVVRLQPNQLLVVELTDNSTLSVDSEFLELKNVQDNIVFTEYTLNQTFDLSNWGQISSLYLGKIHITYNDILVDLCVVLDCKKSDTMTIINPFSDQLKLRPNQFLEVVLFDPDKESSCWEFEVEAGIHELQYQIVQHHVVSSSQLVSEDIVSYPRVLDVDMEHHFWFKPNLELLNLWPSGIYYGGAIHFIGKNTSGKMLYNNVVINLRVKSKDKKHVLKLIKTGKYCDKLVPLSEEVTISEKVKDDWVGCFTKDVDFTERERFND